MGRQPWAPDDQLTWLEAKVPGFHASQNDETTGKYLDRTEKSYFEAFWKDPDAPDKFRESMLDRNGRLVSKDQRRLVSIFPGAKIRTSGLHITCSNSTDGSGTAAWAS